MSFQTGAIAVRLLDADGVTPLVGVAVRVTPDVPFRDEGGTVLVTRAGIMAVTDDDGSVVIEVPPSDYANPAPVHFTLSAQTRPQAYTVRGIYVPAGVTVQAADVAPSPDAPQYAVQVTRAEYTGVVTRLVALEAGGGSGGGAVTSVNTKTGDVTLSAADVGAETPAGAQNKATAARDAAVTTAATDATAKVNAERDRAQLALSTHSADTANPHAVTKAQVGLGNVNNTADTDKPISTAQQAAFDARPVYLRPSGDTTGAADTTAINASLIANGHTRLAAGQWYVTNLGLVNNFRTLQGSGPATVLNVLPGFTGLTLTGPGDVVVADLLFKGGAFGLVVNGAYDAVLRDLTFSGQTSGGIKVNGDLATEQHYTDIVMRGVGGIAFDLQRTTVIYTGSLYLDRVRTVEPAAGATRGFRFRSTAASASLNICFMDQCVADNYANDAFEMTNCAQVFVTNSWFAISGTSAAGSAAMRITGGFQQTYTGCYTYSGLNAPSVVVTGAVTGVDIGGGHVFDGTPTTVALGLSGLTTTDGFTLGTYQCPAGGGLTDTPLALAPPPRALPGYNGALGEEVFSRLFCNSAAPMASGEIALSYFTATKTEVISTIEVMSNDASPSTGKTYAGMGLFTVAANGTLTLVAKGEATTLFGSGYQPVGGFDTKIGIGTYTKKRGQRYAIGALVVSTGTVGKLIANIASNGTSGSNVAVANTPLGPLSGRVTGKTTLGAVGSTIAAGSVSSYGWMPYFVLA